MQVFANQVNQNSALSPQQTAPKSCIENYHFQFARCPLEFHDMNDLACQIKKNQGNIISVFDNKYPICTANPQPPASQKASHTNHLTKLPQKESANNTVLFLFF
jgi:hypothetical protein